MRSHHPLAAVLAAAVLAVASAAQQPAAKAPAFPPINPAQARPDPMATASLDGPGLDRKSVV